MQYYSATEKHYFSDGRAMADGLLDCAEPIERWSLSSFVADPHDDPTRTATTRSYNTKLIPQLHLCDPTLPFFDQYSVPGGAPAQLDIFWLDERTFIVCSDYAREQIGLLFTEHDERLLNQTATCAWPTANLFARKGEDGGRAWYTGLFKLAWTRVRVKLPEVQADALHIACGKLPAWKAVPGLRVARAGRETELLRVTVKYSKDDVGLLGQLEI